MPWLNSILDTRKHLGFFFAIRLTAYLLLLNLIPDRGYHGLYSFLFLMFVFADYLFTYRKVHFEVSQLMGLGIFVNASLLIGLPGLSDDFYRFIWDGRLISEGVNPYLFLPSELMEESVGIASKQLLFDKLNSPDYYTVYPTVCQAIFYLSTLPGTNDIVWEVLAMKSILLLFNIGSILLMKKLLELNDLSHRRFFLFVFNPLLVLELIGNLHFEGVMIFFLLLFVYLYQTNRIYYAAVALAFAISTKMVPLIFLPYILFKDFKKGIVFCLIVGGTCLLLALPLLSTAFLEHIQSSVMLFINNFEFNASIYFLVREIGYYVTGYNEIAAIGPAMGLFVFFSVIILSFVASRKNNISMPTVMVWVLTIYLLMSTTVHPWYVLPLFSLSILTKFNYPLLWTLLVFISYVGYNAHGYDIHPLWLCLEYIPLFTFIVYELYGKRKVDFFGLNAGSSIV